ncbi:endonuclease/exonuclease/phosphatase family protein [Donghicola sp.]|jgi:endonuclease/exonuclease/phosphatase family metal-dependent hydrolase|uniref:endonuclease/exonuclease/phosphatase family protein n=1 Tax=Donghicola sp. TaxID=1929294 RepID=UPI0025FC5EF4|nr:endonuclease/exonuclease/phosphatase family protein [Donghicola sp.]MCT4578209.1 endonuclease/exonuclease/phosphatase family protein [Donghicola sp.]
MTRVVDVLPPATEAQIDAIRIAPRTATAHRVLLADLDCMNAVQVGGQGPSTPLPADPRIIAWNVERCLFPEETAAQVAAHGADVALLSEVDCGMARTQQRHTTADMADALGLHYAFGVEFLELGLGSPTELEFCEDDHNARGWHGNAILSRTPFKRVEMLRLDDHGHWFCPDFGADPGQPRVGGRMALMAVVDTETGSLCVVSTHLESNAGPEHRKEQFDRLLDAIDRFAPDTPVIIGGDLNTGNHVPPDYSWQSETLFAGAQARGYSWSGTPEGMTTRPSLITRHPERRMKLDWFATRGLQTTESVLIASDATGQVLSDHDAVLCRVTREAV